jgi:hypothetical protein
MGCIALKGNEEYIKIVFENSERKRPLIRTMGRYENNIEMHLKEVAPCGERGIRIVLL